MKKAMVAAAVLVLTLLALAAENSGKPATVHGYIIDSACAYTRDLKKPISPACAKACAEAGSPLVLLADDGTVYWPIDSGKPAKGQNAKLMGVAGQLVTATGMVYDRGGSKAIVIEKIAVAK